MYFIFMLFSFNKHKGEYSKLVSKEDFDIHTHNAKLFGIYDGKEEITKSTRELAKRLIYSVLYGGGPNRVGSILKPTLSERSQKQIGYETIDTFYKNVNLPLPLPKMQ